MRVRLSAGKSARSQHRRRLVDLAIDPTKSCCDVLTTRAFGLAPARSGKRVAPSALLINVRDFARTYEKHRVKVGFLAKFVNPRSKERAPGETKHRAGNPLSAGKVARIGRINDGRGARRASSLGRPSLGALAQPWRPKIA